jgi:WD40 repeat protein
VGGTQGLAFSPDGKALGSGGVRERAVRVWDIARGKQATETPDFGGAFVALALSPDGKLLATAGEDETVRLWETGTGRLVRGFGQPRSPLLGEQIRGAVALSPDGKTLFSGGMSAQTVRLWETTTGKELRRIEPKANGGLNLPTACLALSPDGRVLAGGGRGGTGVRLWETATGKELPRQPALSYLINGLAFAPDSRSLAVATAGGGVRVWDVTRGREQPAFLPQRGHAVAVAYSPDGRTLASGGGSDLSYWETSCGSLRRRLGGPKQKEWPLGEYSAAAFSPDGRLLAFGGRRRTIYLWDVAADKELGRLTGHDGSINALAFTGDGKALVSGSEDGTALVWDVTGYRPAAARAAQLSARELQTLWDDLAGKDAARAYRSKWALVAAGERAVALLRERLKPVRLDPQRLDQLVADLAANQFSRRQKATQELEKLGELARPAMQRALESKPALEVRQRVELLLKKLDKSPPPAEEVTTVRGVEVLEAVGTAEARQVLEGLSGGFADSRVTQEAQAALRRLARKE